MAKRVSFRKVLETIEEIAGDDFCNDMEWRSAEGKLHGRNKEMQQKLSAIYRLAHSFNPDHECHHVHDNWRKEIGGA